MRHTARTRVQPCIIGLLAGLALVLGAGPAAAGVGQWTKSGPPGAVVHAIVIDPANASIVLAGTLHGVFRSTDGGSTWAASSSGLGRVDVEALVMSPADANVLFAATYGSGLFQSSDGGATWAHFGAGLTADLTTLAVAASNASVMYAGTRSNGPYKSVDGGATWSPVNNGIGASSWIELTEVDPSDPLTAYAASAGSGLFKTTDGGANWVPVSGLSIPRVLRIDPGQTNTLYVGTQTLGLWKSTDGGGSWSYLDIGLGSSGEVLGLSLDPTNSAVLYAGSGDGQLFKSSDAGANWTTVETGRWPTDVTAIAVAPSSPTTVLAGFSGPGFLRSTDGGGTWSEASAGLTDLISGFVAVTPGDPPTVYGLNKGGVWKSADGGLSWSRANGDLSRMGGKGLVTDPTAPGVVYVVSGNPYKTTDGGSHWQLINTGLPFGANSITIDPGQPATLYAGADLAGVYKSVDGGASWASVSAGMSLYDVPVNVEVSAADHLVVLAATQGTVAAYRSADGAANWVPADTGLPWASSTRMAADPGDPELAYALGYASDGTRLGPYRTTNGGASWTSASSGISGGGTLGVFADPVRPSGVFAGTKDGGVFLSLDAGVTWTGLNPGATPQEVRDFAYDPVTNTLFAAASDGIWSLTFAAPTINGCPLRPGVVGMPYVTNVSATGGVSPYSWSSVSGSLPSGVTFDPATALFSGTPTEVGDFDFVVGVTDNLGIEAQESCSLTIAAALSVTGTALPDSAVGAAYSAQLVASGGVQPFTWTVTGGSLPGGLTLEPSTGMLSGTPTEEGSFAFTIEVADGSGQHASGDFTMTVAAQAAPIPTQTPWGILVLLAAIAAAGVIRLRG